MPDPLTAEFGITGWTFWVAGQPVTQGNHRAFVVAGKARITEKKPGNLQAWRHAIATEARHIRGPGEPLSGPVAVEMFFSIPRPKSLPKRRRVWPIGARSGDVDKLSRAAFDAMTGVLFADDSQVVHLKCMKDYEDGQGSGVQISVTNLETA